MTLRGSTSDFPLESVIGLLAGTSKTGELQVRGDGKVGALGFAGGRLVAVRQNLETSSQDALNQRGNRVRLQWNPGQTFDLAQRRDSHGK